MKSSEAIALEGKKNIHLILVGNPNSGKSSLFNQFTGLNQRVGNFPGVTVEKRSGHFKLGENTKAEVIDLPGTYSLDPRSEDEKITYNYILNSTGKAEKEIIIVVADASNLKRNLLLLTQLIDLGKPCILALNMMDIVQKNKHSIDINKLSKDLDVPVIPINARIGKGINELKKKIEDFTYENPKKFIENDSEKDILKNTIHRYSRIKEVVASCLKAEGEQKSSSFTRKLDKILIHPVWGYVIFLSILFIIFQAIFSWSSVPMSWIENGFLVFGQTMAEILPQSMISDLIVEGIIAGLGGIVIFIPQIALLFAFIAVLEDTGYMARVSFLMDGILKRFGLNGRSIIPLMGGAACAVPAIMSARTISNKKERLLTIFVTPLISCSARIPVYTLIIALIVPADQKVWIFNLQGVVMMALYLLGFVAAITTSLVMSKLIKARERSNYIMDLPIYRSPRWKNIGITIFTKVKLFLFEAGKIIIAVSIVLWILSSYGPGDEFSKIEEKYKVEQIEHPSDELQNKISSEKLEASYAGHFGKFIEPVIKPLGYDWKIGIAILTSFAAREVFVGTMATLYSVGGEADAISIKDKMAAAKDPQTGEKIYSKATGYSLLIFFAFALQCMATVAIVARETNGWKWPAIQLVYMAGLAYFSAFIVYQLFS